MRYRVWVTETTDDPLATVSHSFGDAYDTEKAAETAAEKAQRDYPRATVKVIGAGTS